MKRFIEIRVLLFLFLKDQTTTKMQARLVSQRFVLLLALVSAALANKNSELPQGDWECFNGSMHTRATASLLGDCLSVFIRHPFFAHPVTVHRLADRVHGDNSAGMNRTMNCEDYDHARMGKTEAVFTRCKVCDNLISADILPVFEFRLDGGGVVELPCKRN